LFVANEEGALRLKIHTSLIDLPLDSILKIPDTTVENTISIGFGFTAQPGDELPPLVDNTTYDLGDLALKRVVLRRGKLRLKVRSILETAVDFTYLIPGAYLFGSPFETSQTVPAGSASEPSSAEFEFDLSGYDLDLRGSNGSGFNTLETTYILKTSPTGQTVTIPASTPFLFLEYSFLDIIPNYGSGYFGQQSTATEDDTTQIEFLNRITEGQMLLDSVTIDLNVINGVGADAIFQLDRLSSINTRQNTTVNLSHEIVGSPLLLTRAQDPTGNAANVLSYQLNYSLNNGNSNIKQFIENLPDQLGFSFNFDLNPLGNVSSGNDFFYYDRPFQALLDIDVPLRTTLTNLTLVDTLDWDLSDVGVIDAVNSGSFTLVATNGFPLEGMIEMTLLDEFGQELDALIVPSTIAAPPLDAENKVISPLESRITIPIPVRTSNVLPQTRKIRFKVRFNTANQPQLMEFYASYGMDLKLTGNFNINLGPSTL
ncbi:MAG: hypothetical protein K9J17_13270, partial [Flavobacteriales bacterium]|nr:hypothetical protein [Flavobacteriales bacterium]